MVDVQDFEQIAVTRDLVRKPEIKVLAGVLQSIATGPVAGKELAPVYIMLAHKILTRPHAREVLIRAIEALV